jgi:hypothetical protein
LIESIFTEEATAHSEEATGEDWQQLAWLQACKSQMLNEKTRLNAFAAMGGSSKREEKRSPTTRRPALQQMRGWEALKGVTYKLAVADARGKSCMRSAYSQLMVRT